MMAVDLSDVPAIVVAVILGLWFALSIPHQLTNDLGKRVKRHNPYGLLPGWTFFAPMPGTSNYRLVYRDRTPEGFTDWTEVSWCHNRRLIDAIWHPGRHRTKFVVDCVNAFVITVREIQKLGHIAEDDVSAWVVSVPYMALLNIVNSMPRTRGDSTARQFALVEQKPSDPNDVPKLIVCSAAHAF